MKQKSEEIEQVACECQEHCQTCGDIASSVQVVRVDDVTQTALVRQNDAVEEVDISLVDNVVPGSRLLVHGGVAILVEPAQK